MICIIPKLAPTVYGYSQVCIKGKNYRAHRFVYEFVHGKIPAGMVVMHLCHNKRCINPEHLKLGTYQDNTIHTIESGMFGKRDQRQGRANTARRSMLKGVCYDISRGSWKAHIRVGTQRFSKRFNTLLDAAAWRKSMENQVW